MKIMSKAVCPICNKYVYEEPGTSEICPVCGWQEDLLQLDHSDMRGANYMTLNEAKHAYKNGVMIE